MTAPAPKSLRLSKDRRVLTVSYGEGEDHALPAELLRVESPSAEVQGHDPSQKTIIGGKRDVAITGIEPVGNYAVRLIFSDGHETGIFSWEVLRRFADEKETLMEAYIAALKERHMARESGA